MRGPDTVEHLYYPIQCLLFQFQFYRDFGNLDLDLDLDRQEWGEWNFHIGLCWRSRLPGGAGHSLVVSLHRQTAYSGPVNRKEVIYTIMPIHERAHFRVENKLSVALLAQPLAER